MGRAGGSRGDRFPRVRPWRGVRWLPRAASSSWQTPDRRSLTEPASAHQTRARESGAPRVTHAWLNPPPEPSAGPVVDQCQLRSAPHASAGVGPRAREALRIPQPMGSFSLQILLDPACWAVHQHPADRGTVPSRGPRRRFAPPNVRESSAPWSWSRVGWGAAFGELVCSMALATTAESGPNRGP